MTIDELIEQGVEAAMYMEQISDKEVVMEWVKKREPNFLKDYINKYKAIWPKMEETYFYIDSNSTIGIGKGVWRDSLLDNFRKSIGIIYPDEESAKFAVGARQVLTELKALSDYNKDFGSLPYAIYMSRDIDGHFTIYPGRCKGYHLFDGDIYFSSMVSAASAIEKVGKDRIAKYMYSEPEEVAMS